jgi:ABC-type nickel/cobalt efflux system permease component RcnA
MKLARLTLAFALSIAALALVVPVTSAHPLGNFTINHYSGLRVAPSNVLVDHVTDFAEIPTFTERRTMDTDADGQVSDSEAGAYAQSKCTALESDLELIVGGSRLSLGLTQLGISFPMGQGNPTMRLVCVYSAPLAAPLAVGTSFSFADHSYAERQGWREITLAGDGTTLTGSDLSSTSASDRLTHYPADLLTVPLGQASAAFVGNPGGTTLPAFGVPDATPIAGSTGVQSPVVAPPVSGDLPAVVPAGTTDLGSDVTSLFQAPDLTPPIILLSLLVAAGLGALHALSPGHGKTVMAAYLVGSRGNATQALWLGMTVTVSHTIGVLALGLLSLSAAWIIPADKLYPILSIASGAIVVIIGTWLLYTRVRVWRAQARDHGHAHAQGHDHEHDRRRPSIIDRPEGWHEHDGMGHTHLPQGQAPMGKRGLFALGLSGGMIPSVSALLVLIGAISIGRPAWGVVLTIAFGIGMAAVLVGVGFGLVYARRIVERIPATKSLDLGRRVPVLSAFVVLIAGVLIAGQGLVGLGL